VSERHTSGDVALSVFHADIVLDVHSQFPDWMPRITVRIAGELVLVVYPPSLLEQAVLSKT
jgi:hypothetical protein